LAFYASIAQACDGLLDDTVCQAGNGKAHSVVFTTHLAKRRFLRWAKEHSTRCCWTDPRSKNPANIYFKDLKDLEDAARGKALAPFYDLIETYMEDDVTHHLFPDKANLIADTRKGKLMLRTDDDIWLLATCTDTGVLPHHSTFKELGLPTDKVDNLAASSAQSA
jgi:hypothetical protein